MDTAALEALERIATAQLIMASVMVLIGLVVVGAGVLMLLEFRSARRLLRNMGETLEELKPRLAPLVDRAKHVTDDVSSMTDVIRRRVDDVLHTVEDINRSAKRGKAATEERLRRFAAVIDVVQEEAEELLLDAAATAHGVHETARLLREQPEPRRASRRRIRPDPIDEDEIEEILE